MSRIVIIGGGKIGKALLMGLLTGRFVAPEDCCVVEKNEDARKALAGEFPAIKVSASLMPGGDAILAVKPSDVKQVCQGMQANMYERVLSVAAGITTEQLESWMWSGAKVLRAMLNTPAMISQAASALASGKNATYEDLIWAESILNSLGAVVTVDEKHLDAVTGLSGSGPAYVFLFVEALIDAGVLQGLDRQIAKVLTYQTVLGAAKMLSETGIDPTDLKAQVTSPGGTTAYGLFALEQGAFRACVMDAVAEAARRSSEISKELS
ncbi:MAG: pyrroline-5-carboxylate reductase [Firmicutes bacterium]|nr:pyrroline-5-carboxylate reductase [Bacillota bacterium]